MKDYGLVSIITPNYNCAKFIPETIESILAQSYPNWELLFQDDCSTDEGILIAQKYAEKDSRIKIQVNVTNSGAAVTRNNALQRAKGRWIAFLDSDDLWLPEKLERQLAFMQEHHYSFTYHEYVEIDEDSKELGVFVSGIKKVGKFSMYSCCWPGCLSVMYDAQTVGLVQIADIKKNNDSAMWLKIIKKTDCYLLKESLGRYRRRTGSITPPDIKARILWHYTLFRVAEEMNPLFATFLMGINVVGNSIKKIFFVKKYNV